MRSRGHRQLRIRILHRIRPGAFHHRWLGILFYAVALTLTLPGLTTHGTPEPVSLDEYKGQGICQFATHGFGMTRQTEQSINDAVQQLLDRHRVALGFFPRPGFHVRMRVFGKFEEYTNATLRVYWTNLSDLYGLQHLSNVAGYYSSRSREIITWRQQIPGFLGTTLLHEASHAIMHAHYENVPAWMLEGAAEYFAFAVQPPNDLNQRVLRRRWTRLYTWMTDRENLLLPELLDADLDQFKRMDPEKSYYMSWSVFQMLMSSDANRGLVRRLLGECRDLPAVLPCTPWFKATYPGGWKGFEASWRQWVVDRAVLTNAPPRRTGVQSGPG